MDVPRANHVVWAMEWMRQCAASEDMLMGVRVLTAFVLVDSGWTPDLDAIAERTKRLGAMIEGDARRFVSIRDAALAAVSKKLGDAVGEKMRAILVPAEAEVG